MWYRDDGDFRTLALQDGTVEADAATLGRGWDDALQTVWENDALSHDRRFAEVRARSQALKAP